MRLAHLVRAVFPQHGFGGLERAGAALTRHLLACGVDVALFTRPLPPGEPFGVDPASTGKLTIHTARYGRLPLRPNGIPARLTNYKAFVDALGVRAERMARKGYIDGIYAQGLGAHGVRRASEWGVPFVANPQGMEDFKVKDPLKRLAYMPFRVWVRAGCRAADRVIATDYATRDEVPALLGVDPARVVVIPNGVDIEEAARAVDPAVQAVLIERWPALRTATLRGISVGRLEENKGFSYLLAALAQARPKLGENWVWVLVGDGSLRPALEALSAELGLDEHLIFAGSVSDAELHNLYELSNLFAHPTLYEGSSLVTLEAMSHSLPVVASSTGGIPDKVIEGETGFLVPPGDSAALAGRIAWFAGRPESASRMGSAGARLAEEHFSWDHIAGMTARLFEELLEEKSACKAR